MSSPVPSGTSPPEPPDREPLKLNGDPMCIDTDEGTGEGVNLIQEKTLLGLQNGLQNDKGKEETQEETQEKTQEKKEDTNTQAIEGAIEGEDDGAIARSHFEPACGMNHRQLNVVLWEAKEARVSRSVLREAMQVSKQVMKQVTWEEKYKRYINNSSVNNRNRNRNRIHGG